MPRFFKFCLVGLSGIFINEGLLWLFTECFGIFYLISSLIAIECSIISNYFLNEFWTFRDRGGKASLKRFPKFNLVSFGGLLINFSVLFLLTEAGVHYLLSNLFGIALATFWNYFLNLGWTWKEDIKRNITEIRNPYYSIIIPTYNERDNIKGLIKKILQTMTGNRFEIVIVDDNSPDRTADVVREMQKKNKNIKLVCRKRKAGLSSAVLDGFKRAKGNILVVMDADFSHPPEKLREILVYTKNHDIVIASRYIKGGDIEGWGIGRKIISRVATLLARPLTYVSDPMSGFFAIRRSSLPKKLSPKGFKILLEILAKGDYKIKEVPYVFVNRKAGKSKMGTKEILNYIAHCMALYKDKLLKT
ncbi:MAG: glycosyltransferase [Candidatus Aenigmatarchaeota archaeon]